MAEQQSHHRLYVSLAILVSVKQRDYVEGRDRCDGAPTVVQVGTPAMAEKLHLRDAAAASAASAPAAASKAPAHLAIESGIASGFQMACAAGPLCQDPLWGVAMELSIGLAQDGFDFSAEAWAGLDLREGTLGPVSGQVRRRRRRIETFATGSLVASRSTQSFWGACCGP